MNFFDYKAEVDKAEAETLKAYQEIKEVAKQEPKEPDSIDKEVEETLQPKEKPVETPQKAQTVMEVENNDSSTDL